MCFGVFVFTRKAAAGEQRLETEIARVWYQRGEQYIGSGDIESAIQSFRKATAGARDNRQYALALAGALAAGNHNTEAQQLLLRLRESDPENAEINIYLARLAARRDEVPDAVRYYQNALYGRWNGDGVDERRRSLRTELIRLLLAHQQDNLAVSELLILETELPASAPLRVETADLFRKAGDLPHALNNYVEALQLDDHNVEALAGAGETSFQLGDYTKAAQYLKRSSELAPDSQKEKRLLSLTEAVLDEDPLAPQLSSGERQSRLLEDFSLSLQRLDSCLTQTSTDQSAELQSLKAEAVALQPDLERQNHPPDSDMVKAGVDLIFRIETTTSTRCGQPSVPDEALVLIGHKHNGAKK